MCESVDYVPIENNDTANITGLMMTVWIELKREVLEFQ